MTDHHAFLPPIAAHALLALVGAVEAGAREEVPVGALSVDALGRVLAESGNHTRADHDPTGHAEIVALRLASRRVTNDRLIGSHLSVSLQPCPLCVEALKMARVSTVSFLALRPPPPPDDPRNPPPGSNAPPETIRSNTSHNNGLEPLSAASREIIKFFFAQRRII